MVEKHRKKCSLSRAALARLAGRHQTYFGLLERGERTPNLDTANAIARALGKPLEELIAEAGKLQNSGSPRSPPRRRPRQTGAKPNWKMASLKRFDLGNILK